MVRYFLLFIIGAFFLSCQPKKGKIIPQKDWWYWTVEYDAKSDFIAFGGDNDTLKFSSLSNTSLNFSLPVKGTITKLDWHPNKNQIAVATQGTNVNSFILDIDTKEKIIFKEIKGSRGVEWNSDGSKIALGDNEGNLYIYNNQGKLLDSVIQKQKAITDISWSPNNKLIITVGHHVGIYNLKTKKNTNIRHRGKDVLMLCVSWHPSGDFFVTADYGDYEYNYPSLLQFWNKDGNRLKDIRRSKAEYRNIKWSKDGKHLATASDALRIWDNQGKLIKEIDFDGNLWGLTWLTDKTLIVTDNSGNSYTKSIN